jgi:uncharacterized membrane protein
VLLVTSPTASFKLTWSIRQFNYCCILWVAPPPTARRNWRRRRVPPHEPGRRQLHPVSAYYFGMAALCWFVHPALFVARGSSSCSIDGFRSRTWDVLRGG